MEYVNSSIAIADELERELVRDDSHISPRLQRCVSEILPLFDRLKKFQSPWGASTLSALKKLHEALESTHSLLPLTQDGENSEELVKLMIATRHLWRRQIEMYLAIQLQEVLEKTHGCNSPSPLFSSRKHLHSAAYSLNTPAVPSPSQN